MRRPHAARNALCAAIAAAVLAAACDHASTRTPTRSADPAPVAETAPDASATGVAAHGWIVADADAAHEVLRTCSRPSPDRDGKLPLWTPTPAQIAALERALPRLARHVAHPERFARQYVGLVKDGKRLVYVNAWPIDDGPFTGADGKPLDFTREAMRVCDGGNAFWGVLWNPETAEFSDFQANGRL